MRALPLLLVLLSFAPGCADCSGKKEEVVPAPPAASVQQTPVTTHQQPYKKVMDLKPSNVPKPFQPPGPAPGAPGDTVDGGAPPSTSTPN